MIDEATATPDETVVANVDAFADVEFAPTPQKDAVANRYLWTWLPDTVELERDSWLEIALFSQLELVRPIDFDMCEMCSLPDLSTQHPPLQPEVG